MPRVSCGAEKLPRGHLRRGTEGGPGGGLDHGHWAKGARSWLVPFLSTDPLLFLETLAQLYGALSQLSR